jgi:hypothetical protein
MDGSLVDAWPYFQGFKVGKLFLYFYFFTIFWLIRKREIVRDMIIPKLAG